MSIICEPGPTHVASGSTKTFSNIETSESKQQDNQKTMDFELGLLSTIPGLPEKDQSRIRNAKAQVIPHDFYMSEEEASSSTDESRSMLDAEELFVDDEEEEEEEDEDVSINIDISLDDEEELSILELKPEILDIRFVSFTMPGKPTLVNIKSIAPMHRSRSASKMAVDRLSRNASQRSVLSQRPREVSLKRHVSITNRNQLSIPRDTHPSRRPSSTDRLSRKSSTQSITETTVEMPLAEDTVVASTETRQVCEPAVKSPVTQLREVPVSLARTPSGASAKSPFSGLARTFTLARRKTRRRDRSRQGGPTEQWAARMAELLDPFVTGNVPK
ncbi:MAG: hypothetical protein M1825_005838 [Sarcosagium campestre]|nr:MAG: hypothetical protein M1825_005838 [Sarcosagium campestre]